MPLFSHGGKRMLSTLTAVLMLFLAVPILESADRTDPFYRLQIGRYREEQQAIQLTQAMKKLGHESFYEKVVIEGKGERYRVYVGRFRDREEAKQTAAKWMQDRVIGHYMIREPAFAKGPARGSEGTPAKGEDRKPKKTAAAAERKAEPVGMEKGKEPAAAPPAAEAKAAVPVKAEPEKKPESPPVHPLLDGGAAQIQSGHYDEALATFRKVLEQPEIDEDTRERAQRFIADCYYFLGERGNKRAFLSAVDHYKEILSKYPGTGEKNAAAQYRLAKSYAGLDFHYEAKREFDNLCARYPESAYIAEALFMSGDMSYKVRRFQDAAERLKEYVRRYPDGPHARKAFFNIADGYSRIQQMDQAEQWYREALKRWPDMDAIPQHDVLNLGLHYFRNRKFGDAAEMFFLHANLYPEDENNRDVLYALARSLVEMQQYAAALKMFGQVIERYPESRQAWESIVIIANLGVQQPGLRLPVFMKGVSYYRDPIGTYNFMLRKFPFGELAEGLLFQRGQALSKAGRHKEAFYNYVYLARQFPRGRYRSEGLANLARNAEDLIGPSYARKDYLFISEIYFKIYEKGLVRSQDFKIRCAVGDSLKRAGFLGEALRMFSDLLQDPALQERNLVLVEIADCHHRRKDDETAEKILLDMAAPPKKGGGAVTGARRILADIYYGRGLYEKAASLYADVAAAGEVFEDQALIHRNYGVVLMETKAYAGAKKQFQSAISAYEKNPGAYSADVSVDSFSGLADCLFREGNYADAVHMYKRASQGLPEGVENLWPLYGMARGHARIENIPQARQILGTLRDKGGEGFWTQLADYTLREEGWTAKFGRYIGRP